MGFVIKDINTLLVGEIGYCEKTKKYFVGTKEGSVLVITDGLNITTRMMT